MKILILLLLLSSARADKIPRLWTRIPQSYESVRDTIMSFLVQSSLDNCYQYIEDENYLRMKCLIGKNLAEVSIKIESEKNLPEYDNSKNRNAIIV